MLILLLALLLQNAVGDQLRHGLQALNRGELAVAQADLERASEEDPENPVIWAALARVYRRLEQKDKALFAAGKAEQRGSDNPPIQHVLAMFYAEDAQWEKAARLESRYAVAAGADAQAHSRAADYFTRAGKTELALEEYRSAALTNPQTEESAFALEQALMRSENFAEAAASLQKRAASKPNDPQIRLALGVAYYGLRRFGDATDAFLKTIELAPDTEQPYLFLGKMLDQAGPRLPVIQRKFEAFRARFPTSFWGSFLLAKAMSLGGATPAATLPLLEEAIAKDPGQWEAHAAMADLLNRERNYPAARSAYERAQALNPTEPALAFRLARVYDRLGEAKKAEEQRLRHQVLLAQRKSAGMQ